MSGGLTPEAEEIIDLKLLNLKNEIYDKMTKNQEPYNEMIREMHQEMMGYGDRKGIIGQLLEFECIIDEYGVRISRLEDDHVGKTRIEKLESNQVEKIETKKVIGTIIASVLGTGGILTVIILTILNSGVTP